MTHALHPLPGRSTRALRTQGGCPEAGVGGIESLDLMPGDRRWLCLFHAAKIEG